MPEFLRSLLVILALATVVFVFARSPACALACSDSDFKLRRNLWYAVTCTVFLANNFWIYIIVVSILLSVAAPREKNKIALFFLVLFAVPTTPAEISGMGIISHFFAISYPRLLSLTLLLPAYLLLRRQANNEPFGQLLPDKFIGGYLALQFVLILLASSFTHALRAGIFYAFLDVFLPYYVASRSLKHLKGFRDALMSLEVAAFILSLIGVFEYLKHWLLYSTLNTALGVDVGYGNYLERGDGILRSQASAGHAIPLGFVLAVSMGLYLFLRKSLPSMRIWVLGLITLVAGLLSPVSRGPWVGAASIVLIFVATSRSPGKLLVKLLGGSVIILTLLLLAPGGERFLDLLPFVGSSSSETVGYRQMLLQVAIGVIMKSPFFGAYDYMLSSEMQQMKQGQGIIDIVNSYIGVALSSGLVGLSLFSGSFITVALGILTAMRKLAKEEEELYLLGQVLFSTQIGILIIIFTTGSITFIPVVYWSVAGLGVAYARTVVLARNPLKKPEPVAVARASGFQSAAARYNT